MKPLILSFFCFLLVYSLFFDRENDKQEEVKIAASTDTLSLHKVATPLLPVDSLPQYMFMTARTEIISPVYPNKFITK